MLLLTKGTQGLIVEEIVVYKDAIYVVLMVAIFVNTIIEKNRELEVIALHRLDCMRKWKKKEICGYG